jgi:hypothetical protein
MDSTALITKAILRFTPGQAGALWIGILLVVLVAGNYQRIFSRWNILLFITLLPAVPLLDIMLWERRLGDSTTDWLLSAAFSALFTMTAFIAATALFLALRKVTTNVSINLPNRGLRLLLAIVVFINILAVLGLPAEDSGPYTSLGSQRWMETGTMPYGDPQLRGPDAPGFGAAATYGPLLYVAHIPFHLLMGPPWNDVDIAPMNPDYLRPSEYVTKLTCLVFQLLALFALFEIGRRYANQNTGLVMAIIYGGSPYVLGLGSYDPTTFGLITGLPFISHIAPPAMVLLALLYVERPIIAGLMLAGAVGVLFWPLFLLPVFLGWYVWQQRADTLQFLAAFVVAGTAITIMVVYFTGSIGEQGPFELLVTSTLEHQEGIGQREYGGSKFSFWGTHPELAAFWQQPIFGDTSIFKPSFMLFAIVSALAFFLVRGRDKVQFALLIAFVAAAIQLWKTHAGGTYVEWYLPFLLIGIFCSHKTASEEPAPRQSG